MFKTAATVLIFCVSLSMTGEIDAQCSGSYSNYYPRSYVSSNNFNSCGSYFSTGYASGPSSYGVASNQYSPAPAILPKPAHATAPMLTNSPAGQTAPVVNSYRAPALNYSTPVYSTVGEASPITTNFNSGYRGYLRYTQPTCASGNCPYR